MMVVANIKVLGMMENRCLAKSIHQVGWGMFCTMLKYKAEMSGKIYKDKAMGVGCRKEIKKLSCASSGPLKKKMYFQTGSGAKYGVLV
ncbi:hypothetical protein [Microcoleus sp. LEGE 07076]|uniref:hypothetical protein n=1 Tax=Microcoleus sp. LEGE 07076 TaxID=915322 RepID=UPI0030DB8DE1